MFAVLMLHTVERNAWITGRDVTGKKIAIKILRSKSTSSPMRIWSGICIAAMASPQSLHKALLIASMFRPSIYTVSILLVCIMPQLYHCFPGTCSEVLSVLKDGVIGVALIRLGMMPSAPIRPTVAIAIQTLEFYRLAHFRCPQLSISAFAKALSDNHSVSFVLMLISSNLPQGPQVQFKKYMARQFSIAFDVYLAIRAEVDQRVKQSLGHQSGNW
jgi:hypothetical protein